MESSGDWSEEDLAFSSGFSDHKSRNAENMNVFKERMKEMGYQDIKVYLRGKRPKTI